MNGLSEEIQQMVLQFWPIVLMIVIFYFLLYRPQKNEQKKRANMLESLKKGDRIVTNGGLFGTITGFTDKKITIKVAEKVEVDIARNAVGYMQGEDAK
ncbi:preprotein translocase subunit YajC [Pelorhabdus rhamnosifermentans]|uniref:preprotein translocase subunit YajC n=1 Tax=Pelorhabdus rhamnosifermentans TaxID=2772457 RepID=UPI001C06028C|nr:preprotein translocase subunit YajC [Pelorhabdus rhamnosifermentans]